jgi:glycosyltransferase involved in cell wall biosynthesis
MHIFYWLWKLACSCSDKIIALTNADKQDQVDLKLGPGHKFSVIYNGINIDAQHSAQAPSAQSADLSGHPVIGVIGRLSTEKGQEYLIRAAGILKARYPDIKLLIVGDGAQRSYLASLAEQLNISANVTFTGIVSDVYPLIRRMDIIILPSLYEAFGLVLLEAMAMKKPVIATRVNGVPEIVAEGSTGLLVPPADAGALADAVIKFVDNPDLGRAMGEKGYLRFNQLFSSQQMISQVENLYA